MVTIVALYPRTCPSIPSVISGAAFPPDTGLRCRVWIVEDANGNAVRQESDLAGHVDLALVRPQRVEFGGVHLLDAGVAVVAHGVNRPYPVTGFAGGFRPGPRAPRQILEDRRPSEPTTGHG